MTYFRGRNIYYLRISPHMVIPVFLYLDERHLDWMSERTLRAVISDLRPLILPKLKNEQFKRSSGQPNVKRATVDVHRGDSYQFAYFFRQADPHSVLIKSRDFTFVPLKPRPKVASQEPQTRNTRKRDQSSTSPTQARTRKRPRQEDLARAQQGRPDASDKDFDTVEDSEDENAAPTRTTRRSARSKGKATISYSDDEGDATPDVEMSTESDAQFPRATEDDTIAESNAGAGTSLADDDEEEKPKPMLELSYESFNIYGRCLCVIVEPWPAVPNVIRATSTAPPDPRSRSIAPPDFVATGDHAEAREPTPLFLPAFNMEGSVVPGPLRSKGLLVQPENLTGAQLDEEIDLENAGLLQFSQALNTATNIAVGGLEEDDEIEGDVLFADADEMRTIIQ